MARIGLKLGGNEAPRFRIIFKPHVYIEKCLGGVTLESYSVENVPMSCGIVQKVFGEAPSSNEKMGQRQAMASHQQPVYIDNACATSCDASSCCAACDRLLRRLPAAVMKMKKK